MKINKILVKNSLLTTHFENALVTHLARQTKLVVILSALTKPCGQYSENEKYFCQALELHIFTAHVFINLVTTL